MYGMDDYATDTERVLALDDIFDVAGLTRQERIQTLIHALTDLGVIVIYNDLHSAPEPKPNTP